VGVFSEHIDCCEAVRSAILATAWLLVKDICCAAYGVSTNHSGPS